MATRTLTEFSGTLIRMAAKAEAEAKKTLPKELVQVAPAPTPVEAEVTAQSTPHAQGAGETPHAEPEVEGGPEEKSESGAFSSATEAADEVVSKARAEGEAQHEAEAHARHESKVEPHEAAETEAVKAIMDEAVAKATSTSGDRLARLREAVRATGRAADRVRLVRVFAGEEAVAGAKKIGEHQFLVDLMPHSMKQTFKDPKEEKGARRGPQRPSGSTKNKNEASLEGSFSMDTVAQDRKSERSGPGGAGKRPGGPGGARPGGKGGRSGPPRGGRTSGAPKP